MIHTLLQKLKARRIRKTLEQVSTWHKDKEPEKIFNLIRTVCKNKDNFHPGIVSQAITYLCQFPLSQNHINFFHKILQDQNIQDDQLRQSMIKALGMGQSLESIGVLADLLFDSHPLIVNEAQETILIFGEKAVPTLKNRLEQLIEIIQKGFHYKKAYERLVKGPYPILIQTLGKIGNSSLLPLLIKISKLCKDEGVFDEIKYSLILSFKNIGDPEALETLESIKEKTPFDMHRPILSECNEAIKLLKDIKNKTQGEGPSA